METQPATEAKTEVSASRRDADVLPLVSTAGSAAAVVSAENKTIDVRETDTETEAKTQPETVVETQAETQTEKKTETEKPRRGRLHTHDQLQT